MVRLLALSAFLGVASSFVASCVPAIKPTTAPAVTGERMRELWRQVDIGAADLFEGPWGRESAPTPRALYDFVAPKTRGNSPGLTVKDPSGKEWSVKQGDEAQVEVTLSRVLSALGFHQPPVYYLASFPLDRGYWIEHAPGGRFRPKDKTLKDNGSWSWQQNPFVGTRPYQGLLVILLLFNSSDLKNTNNTLYELREPREDATRWFVVRDIGMALGTTGRVGPRRNDVALFEQERFIAGVEDGFVRFHYRGLHQELVRERITPADVRWACRLATTLSDRQWADAFRASGYEPATAARFVKALKSRIAEGLRVSESG